jgi:hypothetical protein
VRKLLKNDSILGPDSKKDEIHIICVLGRHKFDSLCERVEQKGAIDDFHRTLRMCGTRGSDTPGKKCYEVWSVYLLRSIVSTMEAIEQ